MPKINLITPPDKLFNNNLDILLIYPSDPVKNDLQEIIKDWEIDLNIYVYQQDKEEHNLDWLLSVSKFARYTIFDIDNSDARVKALAAYIIANSNTYWLTKEADPVYSIVSVNRIYDLAFLKEGELNAQSQAQG